MIRNIRELVKFNQEYKDYVLTNAQIDQGIKPLCNKINAFKDLVTINSCQGELKLSESHEHCPLTYVVFIFW